MVIINREPTSLDSIADLVVNAEITPVLTKLIESSPDLSQTKKNPG